jgi:hypothetical protein
MNAYDFARYVSVETEILTQTNIDEITSERINLQETDTIDNTLSYGIFSGLVLTSAILLITLFKKFRLSQKKIVYSKKLQTFVEIPCQKCQFFSNNRHLKCAIRPSSVMNEEAIDCPDYCASDRESIDT